MLSVGFKQSYADHSLFVYKQQESFIVSIIYVDDVVIVDNDFKKIQEMKMYLNKEFSIKDLGPLKYFLGIEVGRTADALVLSQQKYTLDILEGSGMIGYHPSMLSMKQNLKLDQGENSSNVYQYRRLMGRFIYLQATKPYITYLMNILSHFVLYQHQIHLDATLCVLHYLNS